MKIETKAFGTVTTEWVRGAYAGAFVLRVSADNQTPTIAQTRPADGGEYIVALGQKWTRADGTLSPGFKISADVFGALQAEKVAAPTPMPLGKTQIWED